MAFPLSCARKRLTWTASGPDGAVTPSGDLQGEIPSGDPGEEMAAVVSFKVIGSNLLNASFVDFARHDMPSGDQVPQPCRGERINFVVAGGHTLLLTSTTLCDGGTLIASLPPSGLPITFAHQKYTAPIQSIGHATRTPTRA